MKRSVEIIRLWDKKKGVSQRIHLKVDERTFSLRKNKVQGWKQHVEKGDEIPVEWKSKGPTNLTEWQRINWSYWSWKKPMPDSTKHIKLKDDAPDYRSSKYIFSSFTVPEKWIFMSLDSAASWCHTITTGPNFVCSSLTTLHRGASFKWKEKIDCF